MPDSIDQELLLRIPLTARTVLQIGATSDVLAAAYKRMNPRARVLGLCSAGTPPEDSGGAFDQTAEVKALHQAMPFDAETGRIDCIIYDQCLETMREPLTALRRHAKSLAPDGVLLIKVANADHWRHAARMLRGDDAGASDVSAPAAPLFTFSRLRAAFAGLGMYPSDATSIDDDSDDFENFRQAIMPALAALGVDADDFLRRSKPSHYIWRVRKSPGTRLIVSGNMLEPVGGVSHVRVVHPLSAMGSDPLTTVSVAEQIEAKAPADDRPRIFVLHRPALASQQGLALLNALRFSGHLVITEFDDHPDYFRMMQSGGELSFRGVHAVQTSTPVLATVLRQYNPEVAVFPNAIAALPAVRNFIDPDTITLFYGALNREACWAPLMDVVNAVARTAGRRLKFQVVHDRRFFDALDTPHKSFTPTCDYDTYMALLGASELCFMPLSDTPFNRAKSDLKFIECGACRVASVASTVVYGDSIRHDETGLLFRDRTELYNALLRLIAIPEAARALGDAARRYVETERMLAYQVAPRIAWYHALWRRRGELTAALDARMAAAHAAAA